MAEIATRHDVEATRGTLAATIENVRLTPEGDLKAVRHDLETTVERITLRLTVRMGVMLATAVAALAALSQF